MSNTLYATGFTMKNGTTVYYTGRGGDGFLSDDVTQAFYGYTQEYALQLGHRMRQHSPLLFDVVEVVTKEK